MPNYYYKCCECKTVIKVELPISTDPKKLLVCECGYTMKRIIRPGAEFPKNVGRVWAGDWFRKTYGHDMGETSERRAAEKAQFDKDRAIAEKDGAKFKFRSRQVGGKDRIIVPDKKDD